MEDNHSKQWVGSCKNGITLLNRSASVSPKWENPSESLWAFPLSVPCNYTDYLYPSLKFKIWVSFIWRIEPVSSNSFRLVKGQFWLKRIEVKLFRFRNNLVFTATQFSHLRPATWVKVLWSDSLATTGWEHTNVLISINKTLHWHLSLQAGQEWNIRASVCSHWVLSSSTLSTNHYESLSPYLSTTQEDYPTLLPHL